jgi:putative oxidoreductase
MLKKLLSAAPLSIRANDMASLLLRIAFGGLMLINHGWDKFTVFGQNSATFPDPLHVTPQVSEILTIFAELFCAGLLVVGLLTRPAALVFSFCMVVAAFGIHANDPLGDKEHALLFAVAGFAIFYLGAGAYSLDALLGTRRSKQNER